MVGEVGGDNQFMIISNVDPKTLIPYDPTEIAIEGMWKIVAYATGAILLWSYLKTRTKGE